MTHEAAAELLAAYALDAVSEGERAELESHLRECERCRSELSGYQTTAALLGSASSPPPEHLWEAISAEISAERAPVLPMASRPERASAPRRRPLPVAAAVALVAAALVAFFAVELTNLQSQVHQLRGSLARTGLSAAVLSLEAGPHRTIHLTSSSGRDAVTVVVGRDEQAYWVASSLATLPKGRTYQLWGLASGHPVSLGLAGRDPHAYSGFRIATDVTRLMVTAGPAGGTPAPVGAVLAASKVL